MTYLRDIVFAALLCGIITGLSSIGKTGAGKYVKYVSALVFLCILLSPLLKGTSNSINYFDELKKIANNETSESIADSTNETALELIANEICKAAAMNTAETFGVSPDDFSINIILERSNSDEYSIREATVYTSGNGKLIDKSKLKIHFEKILDCNVEVVSNE